MVVAADHRKSKNEARSYFGVCGSEGGSDSLNSVACSLDSVFHGAAARGVVDTGNGPRITEGGTRIFPGSPDRQAAPEPIPDA